MISTRGLYNNFEDAILPIRPGASFIKERLVDLGASGALMSGSGPSVFGIFDSQSAAERARAALASDGVSAFVATSARH